MWLNLSATTHICKRWLHREGMLNSLDFTSTMVEAIVASHCYRQAKTFYFKGPQGEIDVMMLKENKVLPIEVKSKYLTRTTITIVATINHHP